MKKLVVAAAIFAAACASTQPDTAAPPPQAAPDPRIGELQTAMTELLERIDVLNDRIAKLEEAPQSAPEARTTSAPAPAPASVRSEQPQRALVSAQLADNYRKAIMAYGRGSYAEARQAFQSVYDAEPNGDLADNALFWIGETYYASRDYNNAMRFYGRVTSDYADQNKAPDALYKTALAQEKTGDLALARKTLQQVVDRYPYSTSASMAKQEMQRIKY
jgi:tol-pal system protein YbgF